METGKLLKFTGAGGGRDGRMDGVGTDGRMDGDRKSVV